MKSRPFQLASLALFGLLYGGQSSVFAQSRTVPATLAQPSVPTTAAMEDPTHPEVQPPLDVDRDPIPSPALEDKSSVKIETSTTSGKKGELQKDKNGVYTLHADVDEVLLSCTVMDAKGQPVNGLNQDDFRVWENGVAQTVNSVRQQDLPVSMGILVDNSGSMRDKRGAVNAAAFNLLKASNPKDEAFVVNFSDRPFLDQNFTTNLVALHKGLSRFDSKGTTALFDAVAASADQLSKHAKNRMQVLLIITDGEDNASRIGLEQVIRRVQDLGGPVVYSIGLLFDTEKDESDRAKTALEALSQETGGVAYFPHSLEEVDNIAAEVAHDIRNQYTVDYHSSTPARQGGYRVVHVEATAPNAGKLRVRTRRGYYSDTTQQHTQAAEQTTEH